MSEIVNTDALTHAVEDLRAPSDVSFAVSAAMELEVTDQDSAELATDLLKQLKGGLAAIEEQRTALSIPLTRVARQINQAAKARTAPLTAAESALRGRLNAYLTERLREREAARQEAQEAAQQAVVDPGTLPDAPQAVQGGAARASVRQPIVHEVTDLFALLAWCMEHTDPDVRTIPAVDTVALRAFVAAMGDGAVNAKIPGLLIERRAQAVIR